MRTGLASTSVLALALLAGSPALADDVTPQIGDPCTADTVLPINLVCVDSLVAAVPAPAAPDIPTTDPTPTDPPAGSTPSDPAPAPAPPPPVVDVPIPPVNVPPIVSGGGTAGSPVGVPGTGGGTTVIPGSPDQPTAGGSTKEPTTKPGSLQASATTLDPGSTTKSLLTAATVSNLASGDLPTLAAMRSLPVATGTAGLPLSAYMPNPELANIPAATALSTVQAPLLAVGGDAASGGGFTLAGLSSRALPGLLVVLATALVSTVGAGNLRYWQERFGTRR